MDLSHRYQENGAVLRLQPGITERRTNPRLSATPDSGTPPVKFNYQYHLLRHPISNVLGGAERRVKIPLGRCPQQLPELLSRSDVAALLNIPMSMKARTFLMTAYARALRLNELCHLRGCDIDSAPDRMCMSVVNGRGGKDRYGILMPDLLDQLRLC
jgi:site-specific recombinase XerD